MQTKPHFSNQTHSEPNPSFFQKPNCNRTKIKNLFHTHLTVTAVDHEISSIGRQWVISLFG